MPRPKLIWRGDAVQKDVIDACRKGVDATMAESVKKAKLEHWWQNRTGTLEGSIQMRPAVATPSKIQGQWGSFTVGYAIFLEIKQSYLRRAADAEYPRLIERIRGYMP